jgi:serine protease Do
LAEVASDGVKNTFGSGFIYKTSDGNAYIVTNKHVVNNCSEASIAFEQKDGSYDKYENLKVLYYDNDNDIDIALLQLPTTFADPSALKFSNNTLNDGDDVYSAGFPGLADKPVWQLGKGIVSNASARIEELIDPSLSTVIQHTAEIDGGNSGGPLLVKNGNSYYVVGINTWKAVLRQNTNFAIPIKTVATAINNGLAFVENPQDVDVVFSDYGNALWDEDKSYTEFTCYISNDFAVRSGGDAFINILRVGSTKARNLALSLFVQNPIEGLKYALCWDISKQIRQEESEKKVVSLEKEQQSDSYTVSYNFGGKETYSSKWKKELGFWKLDSFEAIKSKDIENDELKSKEKDKKKAKKKNNSLGEMFGDKKWLTATVGTDLAINNPADLCFLSNFLVCFDYVDAGLFLQAGNVEVIEKSEYSNSYLHHYYGVGGVIRLTLPVNFESFGIKPFLHYRCGIADLGSGLFNLDSVITGLGLGLESSFIIPSGLTLTVGLEFGSNGISVRSENYENSADKKYSVGIYAGIKFLEK